MGLTLADDRSKAIVEFTRLRTARMSRLFNLVQTYPNLAAQIIGVDYAKFQQLVEQFGTAEEVERTAAIAATVQSQTADIASSASLTPELLNFVLEATPEPPSNRALSSAEQIFLVLFCLHQTWTQAMASKLELSESKILSYYFGVPESVVDQAFFACAPLLEALLADSTLNLDREEAYRRTYHATGFAHDAQDRLTLLRSLGFFPKTIFDVGASTGGWTKAVHHIFPDAHFYLFEPLAPFSTHYQMGLESIQSTVNYTLFSFALGRECGTSTIVVQPDFVTSSMLTEYTSDTTYKQEIPLMTLDAVIQKHGLSYPELIKIDTQGFELNILAGATEALKHADVLMLECWLVRGYGPETPLLLELSTWLAHHDFYLFDFGGSYRENNGVLISPDCYFIRGSSSLAHYDRKVDFKRIN